MAAWAGGKPAVAPAVAVALAAGLDDVLVGILAPVTGLMRGDKEAARVLLCHRDTLSDFLHKHKKAEDAWTEGKEAGKASLMPVASRAAFSLVLSRGLRVRCCGGRRGSRRLASLIPFLAK